MTCEDICRYGLLCKNPAKWVTPSIKHRGPGGRKVCGVHRHRWEDFFNKCKPLTGSAEPKA